MKYLIISLLLLAACAKPPDNVDSSIAVVTPTPVPAPPPAECPDNYDKGYADGYQAAILAIKPPFITHGNHGKGPKK